MKKLFQCSDDYGEVNRNPGKFKLRGKTVLIPEMNRIAAHLFSATFRGFGVDATVLETYKGGDLGKEHTSGKECYPCQITLGDILYFIKNESAENRHGFNPDKYAYFLPEADGPCRFGMYNRYQRLVLDSFPGLNRMKIVSMSTSDGYSMDGLLEKEKVSGFRKTAYFSFVVADILDRLTWRVRPYEKEKGMTDEFMLTAMHEMEGAFERYGEQGRFDRILDRLTGIVRQARKMIDPDIPRKPRIGIVGEIFLRMHTGANQDLIRLLEKHGAEVVTASLAEWINFVTYTKLREAKEGLRYCFKQFDLKGMKPWLKDMAGFGTTLLYQERLQKRAFGKVAPILDLPQDHKISHLRQVLEIDDQFTFQVITETCIGIAAILEYARMGFDGVVNVYPLTCMPGMATSAVIKPVMNDKGIPYLDTAYDGTLQPGREAVIRTFVYQAEQHFRQNGRGSGFVCNAMI